MFVHHLPRLATDSGPSDLIHLVEIALDDDPRQGLPPALLGQLTQCPVLIFSQADGALPRSLALWAQWIYEHLPTLMPFWGIELEQPCSPRELQGLLQKLHRAETFAARLYQLSPDPYLRLSLRPFILSSCDNHPDYWLELDELLPVLRQCRSPHQLQAPHPCQALPHVFKGGDYPLEEPLLEQLAALFVERPKELLFTNIRDQERFCRLCDLPPPPRRPVLGRATLP
jgi:hypothetical protein